jgi:hypothetical protein
MDVFSDNFDNYYETFNAGGREPMLLFSSFIGDVEKNYQNTDSKECRKLLREFKII